ncbi:MAG: enoyl-CoA hydratase/isomerase family protein [Deltaproteobacteria bacterium]|nr:enoyl-CoA hydratase/isomerase family protein [Deltaproteobacteria bacterium]
MPFEALELSHQQGVTTLTLNRPERLNTIDLPALDEIIAALAEVRRSSARVLVLAGKGKAFCAGADQGEMVPRAPAEWEAIVDHYLDPLRALMALPIPTVAKIHGDCIGGGVGLALSCDFRIMRAGARIGIPFVKIGLAGCDMGAGYFLPRMVGFGRALDLMMTGRLLAAEEAERIGLVQRIASAETFEADAAALVTQLAAGPPRALRATKEAAYRSLDRDREAEFDFEVFAQVQCLQTADHREGVAAFKEKRPPTFKGA